MSAENVEELEAVEVDEAAAPARPQKKRKGGNSRLAALMPLIFLGAILLMMLVPEVFTVIAIGLWPTFVVSFLKPLAKFGSARTVLGFNLAGLMPALEIVWNGDRGMEDAWRVLLDAELIGVAMGAAFVGGVVMMAAPFIAEAWVLLRADQVQKNAVARQQALIEEWGEQLAQDAHPNLQEQTDPASVS